MPEADEPQHVERADEVDLDDLAERLEVVRRAVAVDRAFGPTDARAVDARAQRRDLGRGRDRGASISSSSVTSACANVPPSSLATASPFADVAVDDDDVGAVGGEAPSGGFAHPGRAAGDEGSGVFE